MSRQPTITSKDVFTALRRGSKEFAAPPELAEALDVTPQTIRNNHDRIVDDARIATTKISRSIVYYLAIGEVNDKNQSETLEVLQPAELQTDLNLSLDVPQDEAKDVDDKERESAPPLPPAVPQDQATTRGPPVRAPTEQATSGGNRKEIGLVIHDLRRIENKLDKVLAILDAGSGGGEKEEKEGKK